MAFEPSTTTGGIENEIGTVGFDRAEVKLTDANESKVQTSLPNAQGAPGEKSIPLFDASKMGFNDRAWNDPPPLLMNSTNVAAAKPSGRKLTSRVAFPLDSTQYPSSASSAASSVPVALNPNAPPPMGGFISSSSPPKSSDTPANL